MNSFLFNLFEANALLALLVILYRLAYPAYPAFRVNRWVLWSFPLLAGLGGFVTFSIGSPAAATLPTYNLQELVITGSENSGTSSQTWGIWTIVGGIYWLGVAVFLSNGLYHAWGLLRMVRQHQRYPKDDHTLVMVSGYPVFSFFHWLFWNSDMHTGPQQQNLVYQHERTHIQQRHSWDLLMAYGVKSLCWFNPAVYLWSADIRLNLEYLADEAIIQQSHADVAAYGQTLMEQQLLQAGNPFMNPFWNTQIQNRVHMLTQKNQAGRQQMANGLVVTLIGVLTAGLVACTANEENPEKTGNGGKASTEKADTASTERQDTFSRNEVDEPAQFKGGKRALFQYIQENVDYPASLAEKGITAMPAIRFVVAKDGSVTKVVVAEKAEQAAFNKEAKAVFKTMPDWEPAKVEGKPVRVQYVMSIKFSPDDQ